MSLAASMFGKQLASKRFQGPGSHCYHSTPVRQIKFGLRAAFTARGPASCTGAKDVNHISRQQFENKMLGIEDVRSSVKAGASKYTVLNVYGNAAF